MGLVKLIIFILIGAVSGWIAGMLTKGKGFGFMWNAILGIIGAVVGGWLFELLNISVGYGWGGSIFTSVIGALIVLLIGRQLKS
jgi:uncharacterized membrane protein YeaQ/YmgE (transglycosylase-associated protein family)